MNDASLFLYVAAATLSGQNDNHDDSNDDSRDDNDQRGTGVSGDEAVAGAKG